MSDTLTIRIPDTPSRLLGPNGSTGRHWSVIAREKQALQWNVSAAMVGADIPEFTTPITVSITVAWEKYRKTMDGDNLLASLKAAIDMIAIKIGVDDKNFDFQPIEQIRDKKGRGYMIFTLEGA